MLLGGKWSRIHSRMPLIRSRDRSPRPSLPVRHLAYFVLCFSWSFPAANNAIAQTAEASSSPEIHSIETPTTFKARVNLVLVPVVVRDSQGRAIGNLRKEDFRLFDKGKLQEISKFAVEKPGSQIAPPQQNPSGDPTDKPSIKDPAALPERFTAYLFDDVHFRIEDLMRVRDAAGRHLTALEPTSRAAIFSTSGQTTLDFTGDHAKLNETLLRLQPRPIVGSHALECPEVNYYMADLIQNKNDPRALLAATGAAMACMSLPRDQVNIAQQAARMAASRAYIPWAFRRKT
jgi:VWFA-related protein